MLELLRTATRDAHAALDQRLDMMSSNVSREQYVRFLTGILSVVGPLDAAIKAELPDFGSSDATTRAVCAAADLASLGHAGDAKPTDALPILDSKAAAIGAAYVLEGSTLGGLVLARAINRTLGFDGEHMRYLTFRGDRTIPAWKRFIAELETWASKAVSTEHEVACTCASAVFRAYETALDRQDAFAVKS